MERRREGDRRGLVVWASMEGRREEFEFEFESFEFEFEVFE